MDESVTILKEALEQEHRFPQYVFEPRSCVLMAREVQPETVNEGP